MQQLKNGDVIKSRNSVFNYAHKYYNFTLEEDYYLESLIRNLFDIYKSKISKQDKLDILINENNNILDYRYNNKDLNNFNNFYLECLKFNSDFNITIDNDELYINKFGNIILTNNPDLKDQSVFNFDYIEFNTIKDAIKHNIFTSRIYQYLALLIKEKLGNNAYEIFNLANNHIISYEKTLLQKLKYLKLIDNYARILK